jgi:TolB-like protein
MTSASPTEPQNRPPSVFLSYASQDRPAAQAIRDALPGLGLEAWYDESQLQGGDVWDQKIRTQIRECDFFMPLISAQTEARAEGYFRREWRLGVERTLDMADDHTFLLPIVIDDTNQAGARVPEKFLAVQWLRVPRGQPNAAFEALCRRLVAERTGQQQPPKKPLGAPAGPAPRARAREYPEFPREEPGQRVRFWFHVLGWALQSAWISFNRFPKWVRVVAYVWLAIALLSRGCSSNDDHDHSDKISPAQARKLKQIADKYQGSNKSEVAKLGAQIARELADESTEKPTEGSPLLAIPFSAPSGDPAAQKFADSTFAQVYGRVSLSHRGHVGLTDEPLPTLDPAVALERARANHSTYVLYGAIDNQSPEQKLTVKLAAVADGSVLWSESYPAAGADPAKIAAEVDSKVPSLEATETPRTSNGNN